jgi:hypothetical protein
LLISKSVAILARDREACAVHCICDDRFGFDKLPMTPVAPESLPNVLTRLLKILTATKLDIMLAKRAADVPTGARIRSKRWRPKTNALAR